ncbi:hypothetical protein Tco_1301818 [Tanacetum coccineum]
MEEQLVFYKKNVGMLYDQIAVLKRDASFNESKINALKIQIERLKKEKESNQIKIDNFENASKSLDKLIGSLFAPPTIDFLNFGLEEFKQPEFEGYRVKVNKSVSENSSNEIKKTSCAPIIKDWVSDCDEDDTLENVSESANVQKPKQANQPRKIIQKPVLNNVKKGTGQREVRPVWNNAMRTNHLNLSSSRSNFSPTAVLTKSGLVPISTARQSSSRAATPVSTARPIKIVASKPFVNVVNSVNTAKGKRVISAVGEQGINVVKSTACWVWRPKIKVLDHVSKNNGSYICKQFDYLDPTVSTARLILFSTASATPGVSTAVEGLVYIRRSAKKKKDKGKAIMIEDESVQKKSKKQMQEERLWHEEAIKITKILSEEDLKEMLEIVPVEETKAEALQFKYPIVDWEKLQRYMHDPLTWRLYGSSGVHHVSSTRGQDIFMLVERDYPLTKGLAILMLSNKLRVDQQSEMADELLTKIYNIAKPV